MLILYTTLLSCSTAGEVILTALYCKHWSYPPGEYKNFSSLLSIKLWHGGHYLNRATETEKPNAYACIKSMILG